MATVDREAELLEALQIILTKADELDAEIVHQARRKHGKINRGRLTHRLSAITGAARNALNAEPQRS